jgi:hypothetical protein
MNHLALLSSDIVGYLEALTLGKKKVEKPECGTPKRQVAFIQPFYIPIPCFSSFSLCMIP